MDEFPIMSMKPGDAITVTEEWGTASGTVNWWRRDSELEGGFRVNVKTEDGDRDFPESPGRWAKFWR